MGSVADRHGPARRPVRARREQPWTLPPVVPGPAAARLPAARAAVAQPDPHGGSGPQGTGPHVPGPGAAAGTTFGVEEEFHLVDPTTFELTSSAAVTSAALTGQAGSHVHAEIATTQLETSTGVCTSLAELRAELVATRAEAVAAARRAGL